MSDERIDAIVDFTKELLARRDREAERYQDDEFAGHICVFEPVVCCRICGAQRRHYRESVVVRVKDRLL